MATASLLLEQEKSWHLENKARAPTVLMKTQKSLVGSASKHFLPIKKKSGENNFPSLLLSFGLGCEVKEKGRDVPLNKSISFVLI